MEKLLPPNPAKLTDSRCEGYMAEHGDESWELDALEAKFIDRAAASGKPRGLRWSDVSFEDEVFYARDRRTRGLKALVAIEVSFEAIEGGGMEEVEAVSNVRAATAEFLHDGSRWHTDGRVFFNLAPKGLVRYLHADLESVEDKRDAVTAGGPAGRPRLS